MAWVEFVTTWIILVTTSVKYEGMGAANNLGRTQHGTTYNCDIKLVTTSYTSRTKCWGEGGEGGVGGTTASSPYCMNLWLHLHFHVHVYLHRQKSVTSMYNWLPSPLDSRVLYSTLILWNLNFADSCLQSLRWLNFAVPAQYGRTLVDVGVVSAKTAKIKSHEI